MIDNWDWVIIGQVHVLVLWELLTHVFQNNNGFLKTAHTKLKTSHTKC